MATDLSALSMFKKDYTKKEEPKGKPPKKPKPIKFDFGKDKPNSGKGGGNKNKGNNFGAAPKTGKATAPYNFVSLPSRALPSPIMDMEGADEQEKYKNYIKKEGKFSGYIDLDITTKTPCYIRLDEDNPVFIAPQGEGKEILPGSSIRGMIKNIFKIVTAGAMRSSKTDGDINDTRLYYRTMAGTVASVRDMYNRELLDHVEKIDGRPYSITKASAGFLIRVKGEDEDNNYFICPCALVENGKNFARKKDPAKISRLSPKNSPTTGPNGNHGKCIIWDKPDAVECFSGDMRNKVYYTIHGKPDYKTRIPVPGEVIEAYRNDTTRGGVNLFDEEVAKYDKAAAIFTNDPAINMVVPCFYVVSGNKIKHFGFSQFYRVPYAHSVGEFIPDGLCTSEIDFADAMFGSKELWGSRLMFEDADKVTEKKTLDKSLSHPLTNPKPTSFQLYLEQDQNSMKAWADSPKGTRLRGYKLYWHNNIKETDWKKSDDEKLKNQKEIRPISAGWNFRGKIRFTDLSKIELGALLEVFKLAVQDKDCCFKLGQGKALGMGSVRIEPKLYLETTEYYSKLFTEGEFRSNATETPFDEYCAAFEGHLGEVFTPAEKARYDISQKELAALLSWSVTQKPDWQDRIATMKINDPDKPFQNRWKLPTVKGVIS